jgi:hypothetical protein
MMRELIVKLDRSFAGDTPARNNFHRGFHRRLQQKRFSALAALSLQSVDIRRRIVNAHAPWWTLAETGGGPYTVGRGVRRSFSAPV